ncbi:unknown [Prevotella sp. CAG:1031]|nr:unknown [Prevotella sp. CAG:1031]
MGSDILFVFNGSNAGENFSFDGFEKGTAACRYVADLVCQSELVDAGY